MKVIHHHQQQQQKRQQQRPSPSRAHVWYALPRRQRPDRDVRRVPRRPRAEEPRPERGVLGARGRVDAAGSLGRGRRRRGLLVGEKRKGNCHIQ